MTNPNIPKPLKIKRLSSIEGHTYVCGDIHGSFSCVTRFLDKINFDKNKDRLICAGDIIDRGPDNEKCLTFLDESWFHCVKGNHEQLMEDFFAGNYGGAWWGRNGGYWGERYLKEETDNGNFVRQQVKKIKELPYLITVEKNTGEVFHVIHAELPPYYNEVITDELLADPLKFTALATTSCIDGDIITWGRYLFYTLYRQEITDLVLKKFIKRAQLEKLGNYFNDKLSHIYSGHTIMKRPVTFKGQTNLDTCAYGSYTFIQLGSPQYPPEWCGLTITEPETGKFWFVNDREFKESQPVVIA